MSYMIILVCQKGRKLAYNTVGTHFDFMLT